MDIQSYYQSEFRLDVSRFFAGRTVPYFGHNWRFDCSDLDRISCDARPAFLVCLYFTVLADQAMHCHFRQHYCQFEALTRYPKFCRGLGQFHLNPRGVLEYPVEQDRVNYDSLIAVLDDGLALFVSEVVNFFRGYMPQVDASSFLRELVYDPAVQIPELIPLIDPTVRNQPGYRAYRALCGAIDAMGIELDDD